MSVFVILLGGPVTVTQRLRQQIVGARVVAADGGVAHAGMLGLTPELWVGDLDSVTAEDRARWSGLAQQVHPAEKDKTDGELAVDEALLRGATSLVLVGALGGERTDHALLHVMLAHRLSQAGVACLLTNGIEEAVPLRTGDNRFDLPPGTRFSVLALDPIRSLSIIGAQWALSGRAIDAGSSLVLSNSVTGELSLNLSNGRALLFAHPKDAAQSS
jgi:thiamine pyrophosphokinase